MSTLLAGGLAVTALIVVVAGRRCDLSITAGGANRLLLCHEGFSMSLKCGIVGLPNVGKSTLFNALTKAGVAAENYPFCTID